MLLNEQISEFVNELAGMAKSLQLSYDTKQDETYEMMDVYMTESETMEKYSFKFLKSEIEGEEMCLLSEIRSISVERKIIEDAKHHTWWNPNCYVRYEMDIDGKTPVYKVTLCKVAEDDELRLEPEDAEKATYVCCKAGDVLRLVKKYFKTEEVSVCLSGLIF